MPTQKLQLTPYIKLALFVPQISFISCYILSIVPIKKMLLAKILGVIILILYSIIFTIIYLLLFTHHG